MPKQLPYCFRYSDPNTQRVFYYKGYNRYCIQKVHKDHVFFRCDDSNEPLYAMLMPEASKFDRLVLP